MHSDNKDKIISKENVFKYYLKELFKPKNWGLIYKDGKVYFGFRARR